MKTQVEIQSIQDPDGKRRSRFTIAFQDAINNESLNKQLISFQEKYLEVILECKKILNHIKESKKYAGDSILKWQLADIIVNFLKEVESKDIIVIKYSDSLSRDLGLSKRLVVSMIKFRQTYPSLDMINRTINWDRYRELIDIPDLQIRQLLTEKILDQSVKSRDEIKRFKQLHLKSFRPRRSRLKK
jgi:hypothetical protein